MKNRFLFTAALLFAAAAMGGMTAWAVSNAMRDSNPQASTATVVNDDFDAGTHFTAYTVEGYPDLTYAAENAVKAVVSIDKKGEVRRRSYSGGGGGYNPFFEFFGIPEEYRQQPQRQPESGKPEMRVLSSGSGVLVSADGYIVTNNHVAEGAGELDVTLNDGRTFTARLVGGDPTTDVAVIKIDGENLPFLPFGNSDALRLGEWVLAIGTPYSLQSTVTAGIVSAKGRNLNVIENDMRLESFIQTDAAVNPGNSGGALVNAKGELVGINTLIQSPTGSYAGYSFAVPASIVRKVAEDLREYGVVQRALLGIEYQEINNAFIEEMGEQTGITERGGIYVGGVAEGGAAEAAGIKIGDVLTEINGVAIPDAATLSEQIARYRPNDKVKISVKRGGEMKHFDITLRNRTGKTDLLSRNTYDAAKALGGSFGDLSEQGKTELGIGYGIVVTDVGEGIMKQVGVRRGFVITEINERPIRSRNDLNKITNKIVSIDGVYPEGRRFQRYNIFDRDGEK
jgi:Do/DeqQ family serine protease